MSPSRTLPPWLIGIPFVDGGRDPGRDGGVDCWGLVMLAGLALGITFPDWPGVSCDDSASVGAIMGMESMTPERWTPLDKPEIGAVILFKTDPDYPEVLNHAGICIGGPWFLHTQRKHHSLRARLDNPRWRLALGGIWRWNG